MDADGTPPTSFFERMECAEGAYSFSYRELEKCAKRIESEGLTTVTFKNARLALVQAIGAKGILEYLRIEHECLGEEVRRKQATVYAGRPRATNLENSSTGEYILAGQLA